MCDWKMRAVEGGVEVGGKAEGGRVHGVDAGGEVDFFVGIEAGDAAADVFLADAAQVDAELEGVRAAHVGEVVHDLPGADHARIAEVILRVLSTGGRMSKEILSSEAGWPKIGS